MQDKELAPVTPEMQAAYADWEPPFDVVPSKVPAILGALRAAFFGGWQARHRIEHSRPAADKIGSKCKRCGTFAPEKFARQCNWPECEYRPAADALSTILPALEAKHRAEVAALREAVKAAYIAGATAVHDYWTANPGEAPRGDPEFGEAASDYAADALASMGESGDHLS